MHRTLLLNATYEPITIINWKRAITLLFQGKVEILRQHSASVKSVRITLKLPSVLKLVQFINIKKHASHIRFSRENVLLRDLYMCQYCGKKLPINQLTLDHVIPVANGGKKNWSNIVTSCIRCNQIKGQHTPESRGLKLIRKPSQPSFSTFPGVKFYAKDIHEHWMEYLY